jgi:UDP-3-O-[3-hydroxymyristoyl] glucosamine N-acyltransferase
MKDVAEGSRMFGYPARPDKEAMRITACLDKLPELVKEVKRLKAALGLEEGHE